MVRFVLNLLDKQLSKLYLLECTCKFLFLSTPINGIWWTQFYTVYETPCSWVGAVLELWKRYSQHFQSRHCPGKYHSAWGRYQECLPLRESKLPTSYLARKDSIGPSNKRILPSGWKDRIHAPDSVKILIWKAAVSQE